MNLIQHLEWDSQFFGFPVGAINLNENSNIGEHALRSSLQCSDCRLVYYFCPASDESKNRIATTCDGVLTDTRIVYKSTPESLIDCRDSKTSVIVKDFKETSHVSLLELAFLAGSHSRFQIDPNIPTSKFRELYELWIERSVELKIADRVLVTQDETGNPSGLLTLTTDKNSASIGLVAVDENMQGMGIGSMLMKKSLEICPELTVTTQKNNTAACRLYERFGFKVQEATSIYHYWLYPEK